MSDTDATPLPLATDLNASSFERVHIWLPELMRVAFEAGSAVIQDRTFTECLLEGPAVVLAAGGLQLEGCNLGYTAGDIRNLLLRPVAPSKAVGALPFRNCRFDRCEFFAVGFTGPEDFIRSILAVGDRSA
jgi:hypothetical protein